MTSRSAERGWKKSRTNELLPCAQRGRLIRLGARTHALRVWSLTAAEASVRLADQGRLRTAQARSARPGVSPAMLNAQQEMNGAAIAQQLRR